MGQKYQILGQLLNILASLSGALCSAAHGFSPLGLKNVFLAIIKIDGIGHSTKKPYMCLELYLAMVLKSCSAYIVSPLPLQP